MNYVLATGRKSAAKICAGLYVTGEDWDNLFRDWEMVNQKFQDRLAEWSESDLDTYAIPHPVLGLLSTRQMLLFVILHNEHHLQPDEKRAERIIVIN